MFGYIVAGITAAVFGGIAVREATKPTGDKVKDGDTVFVHADALRLADTTAPQVAPVVLELVSHIAKLVNAGEDEAAQREALYLIAESTKARLDQLKFPNEPQG